MTELKAPPLYLGVAAKAIVARLAQRESWNFISEILNVQSHAAKAAHYAHPSSFLYQLKKAGLENTEYTGLYYRDPDPADSGTSLSGLPWHLSPPSILISKPRK